MASEGSRSRIRHVPANDASHGLGSAALSLAAPAAKTRLSTMQMFGCGIIVTMGFVVIYMYRVIGSMHKEQQSMRHELQRLSQNHPGMHRPQVLRQASSTPPEAPPSTAVVEAESPLADPTAPPAAELQGESRVDFVEVDDLFYDIPGGEGQPAERRKLSFMATVGTEKLDGCYLLADNAAAITFDVSDAAACLAGNAANNHRCPDCFITDAATAADVTLTINSCSTASWIRGHARAGVWMMTFINAHNTRTLTVEDNSGSGLTYNVPPNTYVEAYCSSVHTSPTDTAQNKLMFPSWQLPKLTVDNSITLSAGNFDASASTGTFQTSGGANTVQGDLTIEGTHTLATGSGAVTINGDTTITGTKTLTVGATSASGGDTTLYGNLIVGEAGGLKKITLQGAYDQTGTGAAGSFSTGAGDVSLNGDTTVANDKFFHMSGSGTFTTSAGDNKLTGHVTISSGKTFSSGDNAAVNLKGDTTIDTDHDFTIGAAGSTGTSTIYTATTIGATSSNGKALNVIGHFVQSDDGSATASTFSTGTGAHTLNGDVEVTANKNLKMTATSTGTFSTGVGAVLFNGNVAISEVPSPGLTFSTGTGAVKLNGATEVTGVMPFTVGDPSTMGGGNIQLFGHTYVGGSSSTSDNGASKSLTVYGDVTFKNDGDGTLKKLVVDSSGQHEINGNLQIGAGFNLEMDDTGGGTFSTATGPVNLKGVTSVASPKAFTIAGTGGGNAIQCGTQSSFQTSTLFCTAGR